MDIRTFFPPIDHEILKGRIRRTVKDPEVLRLSDLIIDGSNEQEQVSSRTGDEDHGVEGGD